MFTVVLLPVILISVNTELLVTFIKHLKLMK